MRKDSKPIRPQTDQETLKALKFWEEMLKPPQGEETMTEPIKATVNTTYPLEHSPYDDYDPFLDPGIDQETGVEYRKNIDHRTGEVLPASIPEQDEITIYQGTEQPEYLMELNNPTKKDSPIATMDEADKAALLSLYESARTAKSFKEYLNMEVDVYGAIIWYHPPFRPNVKDEFGNPMNVPQQPGYHQVLLLTMDEGKPQLIKAAYGALAVHIQSLLNLRGWYIWDEPVKYKFNQDIKTNAFQMVNIDRVKSLLAALLAGKKRK